MPECVEAEMTRRGLEKALMGKELSSITINDSARLGLSTESAWLGLKLMAMKRWGKIIGFEFEEGRYLTVSMGMSGSLVLSDRQKEIPSSGLKARLVMRYENWSCMLVDPRRLARVSWDGLRPKGWDILDAIAIVDAPESFMRALKNTSMAVKTALMDQSKIAGLGNVYANEILFAAGLNPKRRAGALRRHEIEALWNSARTTLREALAAGGISMRNYSHPNGTLGRFQNQCRIYGRRRGEPCMH
ncbi:MAG: hypothetical protein HY547_08225, partial [Elusimicrobia bacterium]|nr:hypothetical protein [Elusimicrobiota bacterium]